MDARSKDLGKTLTAVQSHPKGVAYEGPRENAEWALEVLRNAGIDASLAEDPDLGAAGPVHVLVDDAALARARESLQHAAEASRRRIGAIAAGLRRSALRGLVPALVVAMVEGGVNRRELTDLLPWLLAIWGMAFVLFARHDHREHGRTSIHDRG